MAGRVGGNGGPRRGVWSAGSASIAGRVKGNGGPGLWAWRAGLAGMAGLVVLGWQAGLGREARVFCGVGQEWAGSGCFSYERTHEWILEMCVPFELAREIKLATIVLSYNFRQSATIELCHNFRRCLELLG